MTDYDNNSSPNRRTPTNHAPGVSAFYLIKKGNKMKWWAYTHSGSGKIILKRYFVSGDIVSADRSPYVRKRTEPFTAENQEQAKEIATVMLNEA